MSTDKKPKKQSAPPAHPTYAVMIAAAIGALKERSGSSRQAILKYIKANYKVGDNVDTVVRQLLRKLVKSGALSQPKGKGASGSFKLVKTAPKKKAAGQKKKKPAKKAAAKKPAAKKAAKQSAKKAPKAKKPAAKKSPAKKSSKKAAAPKKKPAKKASKAKKQTSKKAAKKPPAKKSSKK